MTSNLKKNIDNVSNLAEKVDEMTSDYEFEVLQKLGQIAREIKDALNFLKEINQFLAAYTKFLNLINA